MKSKRSEKMWRLRSCPFCEYSLAELSANHACPECGFEYQRSMLSLPVWDYSDEPSGWILLFWITIVLVLGIVFLSFGIVWLLWSHPLWIIFVGVIFLVIVSSINRFHLKKSGRTDSTMLVTEAGILIIGGERISDEWCDWAKLTRVDLQSLGKNRWRLLGSGPGWWGGFVPPIDVSFRAGKPEAAAARNRMRRLLSASRRPDRSISTARPTRPAPAQAFDPTSNPTENG